MAEQHELLAVEPSLQAEKDRILKETEGIFKHDSKLRGHSRSYKALEQDGLTEPDEDILLVTTVPDRLDYMKGFVTRYIDAVVSKETTNTEARADIEVAGTVIAKDVPAQALLNLEARINEIRKVLDRIPTLDNKIAWEADSKQDHVFRSPNNVSFRMEKQTDHRVIVPATEQHPAQIADVVSNVRIGEYHRVDFSGEISSLEKAMMLRRTDELLRSVKKARQRANKAKVKDVKIGDLLFAYILDGNAGNGKAT